MKVLLGVDLGTSAYKAVALTIDGGTLARGSVRTSHRQPAPGQVQFSAEEHFRRLCRLLRGVSGRLPPGATPVGLCLAGANGNTLLLDARYRPLAPAISWLDTRAGDDFRALLPGITPEEVRATVGWGWSKRFPLTELAWLRRQRPALYRKARYVALDTAYYHHRLTGRLALDHSSATTFFLQDQTQRRWHAPFLQALDLEPAALPDLVATGARIGGLTRSAARATGLPAGLPVVAGSFDHPSAALGAGVLAPGDLLLSCGTSWVGFAPTEDRDGALASGMIVDPFLQPGGPWGAMFALTAVGTIIDRYLTTVFPLPQARTSIQRYRRFDAAAGLIRPGQEGPPIDPLLPLPADRAARRRLCRGSSPAQLSRRLMAGVALALRRRLNAVSRSGFEPNRITMVGGPSRSPIWPQIVADVLGRELWVGGGQNAGAVGAALRGGLGLGYFRGAAEAAGCIRHTLIPVLPDSSTRAWYDQFDWQ